jgi:hypothetical protein
VHSRPESALTAWRAAPARLEQALCLKEQARFALGRGGGDLHLVSGGEFAGTLQGLRERAVIEEHVAARGLGRTLLPPQPFFRGAKYARPGVRVQGGEALGFPAHEACGCEHVRARPHAPAGGEFRGRIGELHRAHALARRYDERAAVP